MFSYYYFPVCWWYVLSKYPTIVYSSNLNQLVTNLTLQIAALERTRCIKILTPNNLTADEMGEYHFLMKSMSMSHMCGMYEMEKYYEIVDNEVTKISCFKPIRILLGSERSKEAFATELTPLQFDQLIANVTREFAFSYKISCATVLETDCANKNQAVYDLAKSLAKTISCQIRPIVPYNKYEILYKPRSCSKSLHVVYGLDLKIKSSLKKLSKLYPTSNAVWLVFLNTSISDFFEGIYLTFSMEVIAARIVNLYFVEFFEVYRVDEGFPMRIVKFGTWSSEEGLDVVRGSLYSRRFDLEGKVLRIGYTENWPFTTFSAEKNIWDGLYVRVWMELQRLLNFTSVNYISPDNSAGILEPDGNWNGLVGMIVRKEIDVIVSELRVTAERLKYLDFTYPLISSWYQVYFKQPGYNLRWDAIFKPFDLNVWIAIIMWIITGTLILSVSYYFSLLYGFESNETVMRGPTEAFFFIVQSLSQQGSSVIPKSITCRFLFFLSYLVSSILIPSYSASLISSLTYHSPFRPFDSFEEMLKDGRYKLYVEKNTAEYSYFADSDEKPLQLIKEKLIRLIPGENLLNNSMQMVDIVCDETDNHAYFGIAASFDAKIGKKKVKDCPILSFTRPLSKVHESMALAKGHPYTGLINYYLHRMVENGITDNIRKLIWPVKEPPMTSTWTPVDAVEVFQIFIFLISGILVSVIFFVIEKYFSIVCTKQKYQESIDPPKEN